VKNQSFDIVHGHNPYVFAKTAKDFSKKKKVPFILELHGLQQDIIYSNLATNSFDHLKKVAYAKLMEKYYEPRMIKKANVIITQTQSMKDRISTSYKIPSDKINIIPNGVNHKKFNPSNYKKERKIIREENKWNNKIVFMYSGYLNDINGIKFFLENMKHLPQKYKQEIQVAILGRGNLEKYVQSYTKKDSINVSYLGLIPYEKMPSYYAACDVFVIPRPSTPPAESLTPMKLLEAMAMEKIVLVSSVKGMTEIIEDKVNGFVYAENNQKEFLKAINYLSRNYDDLKKIGKKGRLDVISHFSWKKSNEKLSKIYETL
jgi:glycosyltransferase involved in cell wall biosynthesis